MSSSHSRERFRLARLAVVLGGVERGVSTVSGALRIALLVWGLSSRDYGLYVALLGVVATASLTDFGLQYGLVNAIAKARGEDKIEQMRELVASGFVMYTAISTVAFFACIPLVAGAPLTTFLRVPSDQAHLAHVVAIVGFAGIFATMPLKVTPAALIGLQDQHIPAIFRSCSGLFQLALLAGSLLVWRGQLLPVVAIGAVADPLAGALFTLWARKHRPSVALSLRAASLRYVRPLLASSMVFFVSNLANLFKRSFVTIVISHRLGPEAVPPFSVPFALFTIALGVSDLIAGSLWPAYGESGARGDWAWVQRAFSIAARAAAMVAVLFAVLGAWAGDDLIRAWTSKVSPPGRIFLCWLAIWLVTQSLTNAAASLLCGLNRNWLVMWSVLAEGVLVVGASSLLLRTTGIEGVAAALALCGAIGACFLNVYAVPRATDDRVHVNVQSYTRIAGCGIVAFAVGGAVRQSLGLAGPLSKLVVVALVIVASYAASAWAIVLAKEERARVLKWLVSIRTNRALRTSRR